MDSLAFPGSLCVWKENKPEDMLNSMTTIPPESWGQRTSPFPSFPKPAFLRHTAFECLLFACLFFCLFVLYRWTLKQVLSFHISAPNPEKPSFWPLWWLSFKLTAKSTYFFLWERAYSSHCLIYSYLLLCFELSKWICIWEFLSEVYENSYTR